MIKVELTKIFQSEWRFVRIKTYSIRDCFDSSKSSGKSLLDMIKRGAPAVVFAGGEAPAGNSRFRSLAFALIVMDG